MQQRAVIVAIDTNKVTVRSTRPDCATQCTINREPSREPVSDNALSGVRSATSVTPTCDQGFSALFSSLIQRQQPEFRLARFPGANLGQEVNLEIADSTALKLAFVGYGLPIILLLVGALIGHPVVSVVAVTPAVSSMTAWSEIAATLGGSTGFFGGLIAYKPLAKWLLQDSSPIRITGIVLASTNSPSSA